MAEDFIKAYWDNQGKKHKESHWASWGDHHMLNLEIELISSYIEAKDTILDVGCANGFSVFEQIKRHPDIKITGVDFSEEMVHSAQQTLKTMNHLKGNCNFKVGDIRALNFEPASFDTTYTTRVLINLPTWEMQKQGLRELFRVTRSGGKVILCEAFWEPLVLLNSMRALKNLPALVEHDFNRYIKVEQLEKYLVELGMDFQRIDFSSVYYLGSRFLRELVTNPEEFEGYSNPINKIFFDLEREFSGGGFGIQQAYVIDVT